MQRMQTALLALFAIALLVPAASAHERYETDDGNVTIVLGEQDEPVYTYDWTNLDLILSDSATGNPIEGAEETLQVTFIAPNGDELSLPLAGQHGSPGRYQFEEGYFLTLPGQYQARLEGSINGSEVSGEYLLPGPRGDMKTRAFPVEVPEDLVGLAEENAELRSEIEDLRSEMESLRADVRSLEQGDTGGSNGAPGPAAPLLVAAFVAMAFVLRRRA